MQDTETTIRQILQEVSGIPADVSPEADLYMDLGMASVHALQLLAELEDRFSLHIPDDAYVEATSISKLTQTIESLKGTAA